MAVSHDAVSESHSGSLGNANDDQFSWTHTPSGTPRGVLVFIRCNNASDPVTAVSYGGQALSKPSGSYAVDPSGEPCSIQAWFLGSGIPTGAQSVVVDRTNNAVNVYGMAITQQASANTEVYTPGIVVLEENQALTEQNVDDGSPGTNSMRYGGVSSGVASPTSINGPNSTTLITIDFGDTIAACCRENSAGQGSRPVGFDLATDDTAFVGLAVREIPASTFVPKVLVL